jgi:hypothetical protein
LAWKQQVFFNNLGTFVRAAPTAAEKKAPHLKYAVRFEDPRDLLELKQFKGLYDM